jgi:hypothetical protein
LLDTFLHPDLLTKGVSSSRRQEVKSPLRQTLVVPGLPALAKGALERWRFSRFRAGSLAAAGGVLNLNYHQH